MRGGYMDRMIHSFPIRRGPTRIPDIDAETGAHMTTLIIGGDRIKPYKEYLTAQGLGPVLHWSGRKKGESHRTIPFATRLVVIMVDQVNHGLSTKTRRIADDMNLPVVFSTRSIDQLRKAVSRFARDETTSPSMQ